MIRTTPRRNTRKRTCESCRRTVYAGETYLEHVASPNHDDLANTSWWRTTECRDCATRYGRGALFA